MTGCPNGGGPAGVDGCAQAGPHAAHTAATHRTPSDPRPADTHAAPCLLFACETSVCSQIAKRAYLRAFRVIYKYIYIVTRKAKKIHKFCLPPHTRRLGRLKNTSPPRIYTATSTPAATLPRCSAYRSTPPGRTRTHRESRPDPVKRNGAKWCDIRRYNCEGLTVIRRYENAITHGTQRALYRFCNILRKALIKSQ